MAMVDPNIVWQMANLDSFLPPGDGWMPWLFDTPMFKNLAVVELWRLEWGNETKYMPVGDIPTQMNIFGLWWRPG